MKISTDFNRCFPARRRTEEGMAVIVVIALFAIMLLFLGGTLRSLNHLRQDLKLIERQQLERIRKAPAVSHAIVTNLSSLSPGDGHYSLSSAGGEGTFFAVPNP